MAAEQSEKRLRVVLHRETKDFIHNDIGNAVDFLMNRARARFAGGDEQGIFLDWMACAVMLAFEVEANTNFVGWHVFGDQWVEMKPTKEKIKALLKNSGMDLDWNQRPLKTIVELWAIRNVLAHGKPTITSTIEEAVGTHSELEERWRQKPADHWENKLRQEFLDRAHADTEELHQKLLAGAGISYFETLSGGSGGMTFVAEEPDKGTK